MRSFGGREAPGEGLRLGVRIAGRAVALELRGVAGKPASVAVYANGTRAARQAATVARWVICADLDLKPFYRLARRHRLIAPIIRTLHGIKPMRPASLFEMMITAITEQQISLAAARKIRGRLVAKFGDLVAGCPVFPTPAQLGASTNRGLRSCGLSRYKADYVRRLALRVASGAFDPDELNAMSDDRASEVLLGERGFGAWSTKYVLVRGLARADCVPLEDLGVRDAVGQVLGSGKRASPAAVERLLKPLAPYRGLAAFYLLAFCRHLPVASRKMA